MDEREPGQAGQQPAARNGRKRPRPTANGQAKHATNGHDDDQGDEVKPLAVCPLAGFKHATTRWFLPGLIPEGELAAVCGKKGAGKSKFVAAVIAACTASRASGPFRKAKDRGPVLLFTKEDNPRTVVRGLVEKNGGDTKRVYFPGHGPGGVFLESVTLPCQLLELEKTIVTFGIKLVAFDPITDFCAPGLDLNAESSARNILVPLSEVARRTACKILVVRHPVKGTSGDALEDMLGSGAWTAVPRVTLCVQELAQVVGRRVVKLVASNLWPHGKPRPFELHDDGGHALVKWLPEMEPDDPLLEPAPEETAPELERETALDYLKRVLADGEWHETKEMREHCERVLGVARSTFFNAGKKLNVEQKQFGKGQKHCSKWRGRLPKEMT